MIELTPEMKAAVKRRMGVPDGHEMDPWMGSAIEDVLALVERDYEVRPRAAASDPFGPIVDPCTGCGCAKAWHTPNGCVGDFMCCPCETWMPLDESSAP